MNNFYDSDEWNLTEHPTYQSLTEKQRTAFRDFTVRIDFTVLTNISLRERVKSCCKQLLEEKTLSLPTFSHYVRGVKVFLKYAEDIGATEKNLSGESFREYLIANGYTVNIMSGSTLDTNMVKRKYNYGNIYERFFVKLEKYIGRQSGVKDDDVWDIRDFDAKEYKPSRPRYTISFKAIPHESLKVYAKKYITERLKTKTYATCIDDLKGIALFGKFLCERHPEISGLQSVTRDTIESFLAFMNTDVNLAPRTRASRIGSVRTFFEICAMLGYEGAPARTLFYSGDYSSPVKVLPKFYDETTVRRINGNLDKLPPQIARMLFVLINVGMRISELCELTPDCVTKDSDGEFTLTYYQPKTRRENRLPVTAEVGEVILQAIDESRSMLGGDTAYVFAKSKVQPISTDSFTYHTNKMIFDEKITNSTGELVRIRPHMFRGTVATGYVNAGISLNMARILLGQSSFGALKYYAEIHDKTIMDAMDATFKLQNDMITGIGGTPSLKEGFQTESRVPLFNGWCLKPETSEPCKSANSCYGCAVWRADARYLSYYKNQFIEASKACELSEKAGCVRLLEANRRTKENLERIIKFISGDKENEQNGRDFEACRGEKQEDVS